MKMQIFFYLNKDKAQTNGDSSISIVILNGKPMSMSNADHEIVLAIVVDVTNSQQSCQN